LSRSRLNGADDDSCCDRQTARPSTPPLLYTHRFSTRCARTRRAQARTNGKRPAVKRDEEVKSLRARKRE